MTLHNDLFNKIKASIEQAQQISTLKNEIEETILNTVNMVPEMTNNKVKVVRTHGMPSIISGSEDIIHLSNNESFVGSYAFPLIGYSIHPTTGFPVIIHTRRVDFTCNSTEEIQTTIADIISLPETAMKIADIISAKEDDDPF